jgi:hypothetical protein
MLPTSFGSFGKVVSEEKIFRNRPIRNKNGLWCQGSCWALPMSPFAIFNFFGDNIFIFKNYLDSIKGN